MHPKELIPLCAVFFTITASAQSVDMVKEPYQGGWRSEVQAPAPATDDRDLRLEQEQGAPQTTTMADRSAEISIAFNTLRTQRLQALERNEGDLTPADRKSLQEQARTIENAAPTSFEAHMAKFYAEFPDPASFQHLDRAAMRSPERMELIGPKLADANRRNNRSELVQWSRALRDHGNVEPALWDVADDMLASVDADGILVTAGEMDTYPILARQHAQSQRRDVLVIDIRLLDDPAYRQRIWERTRARGKVPGSGDGFIQALSTATDRTLFLSTALGADRIGLPHDDLYVVGLALRYDRNGFDNIPILEKRWSKLKKNTGAGPLSRNYLLAGIVLLQHYRQQEIEEKAMGMEHELRELAKALGATQDLYRLGVLQH